MVIPSALPTAGAQVEPPRLSTEAFHLRVVGGSLFLVAAGIGAKLLTLVAQVVLAWWLVPSQFGAAAIAFSIFAIIDPILGAPARDALVQRGGKQASDVFWFALTVNTLTAIVALFVASSIGKLTNRPDIAFLFAVLVLCWPLRAFTAVYVATLYRGLRFSRVAGIRLTQGLIQVFGSVVLAFTGFGAMAIILPNLMKVGYAAIVGRLVTEPLDLQSPQFRSWPQLIRRVLPLQADALFSSLRNFAAPLIVGVAFGSKEAGIFFLASQLASQTIVLLTTNVKEVFFPSLTYIDDDMAQQLLLFRRMSRVLFLLIAPICILQAFLAVDLVPLLFSDKWSSTAPLIIWTSLGMIPQPIFVTTSSLLMANGRFKALSGLSFFLTMSLVTSACIASLFGESRHVAMAIAVTSGIVYTTSGAITLRICGDEGTRFRDVFGIPMVIVALTTAVTGLISGLATAYSPIVHVTIVGGTAVTVFLALCWKLAREDFEFAFHWVAKRIRERQVGQLS